MIVYVESNFLLELALGQEEASAAEAILRYAERGEITLLVPGLALAEPFSTLTYREVERARLSRSLEQQIKELARSAPHQEIVAQLRPMPPILAQIRRKEQDGLERVVERLLIAGEILAIDITSFRQAMEYEIRYDLAPQDAIIYANVIGNLAQQDHETAKCFASRNVKDFAVPGMIAELRSYNCRYSRTFQDALNFIQGVLGPPSGS